LELATAEVVWRAERPGSSKSSNRNLTLRREKFSFDSIMAGPTSTSHLETYIRHRTKRALLAGKGITTIALACGEETKGILEPPVALVLGEGGGQGMAGAIVEEVFEYMFPATAARHQSTSSKTSEGGVANSKLAHEQGASRVSMSAVVVCDGHITDLLGPRQCEGKGGFACRLQRHTSSGKIYIANAANVQIKGLADYERLVGVLLGRRAAVKELIPLLEPEVAASLGTFSSWLTGQAEATLLVSISASGGSIKAMRNHSMFTLACPCGDKWASPGPDLCLLAEALSCFPHQPPPSMVKASPLAMLLLDPAATITPPDVNMIVGISRRTSSNTNSNNSDHQHHEESIVRDALKSLRISGYLDDK